MSEQSKKLNPGDKQFFDQHFSMVEDQLEKLNAELGSEEPVLDE